jgi:hypothetical protein
MHGSNGSEAAMGENVTINPRDRATPVDDPAIVEARSPRTGVCSMPNDLFARSVRCSGSLPGAISDSTPFDLNIEKILEALGISRNRSYGMPAIFPINSRKSLI